MAEAIPFPQMRPRQEDPRTRASQGGLLRSFTARVIPTAAVKEWKPWQDFVSGLIISSDLMYGNK